MRLLTTGLILALAVPAATAQISYRQDLLENVVERRTDDLDALPEVHYEYHVVSVAEDSPTRRLSAKAELYRRVGEENKGLVMLLNRNDLEDLHAGDTLIVPTDASLDFRAYSPFPRYWPGARDLDKVVVLDKSIQAFAAYASGRLERWGVINTGTESSRTPSGRFNVNWKQDYRISTLSPGYGSSAPDAELWEMHWVMNIHEARGIHLHQYALPLGGPASHGCVRMADPDARWLYDWTDTWEKTGGDEISSVGATIHRQGTMVLVLGQDISGPPLRFTLRDDYPVLNMVRLPDDPWGIPPGSPQQAHFDRLRLAQLRADASARP